MPNEQGLRSEDEVRLAVYEAGLKDAEEKLKRLNAQLDEVRMHIAGAQNKASIIHSQITEVEQYIDDIKRLIETDVPFASADN